MCPLQGHRHRQSQEGDAKGTLHTDYFDHVDNDDGGGSIWSQQKKVAVPGWGSCSYASLEPLLDDWMDSQLKKVSSAAPPSCWIHVLPAVPSPLPFNVAFQALQ